MSVLRTSKLPHIEPRVLRSAIATSSSTSTYRVARAFLSPQTPACQCSRASSRRWASTSASGPKALPNHYATLGLPRTATSIEISRSVKAHLVKFHPDRHRTKSTDEQARMRDRFDEAMRAANVLQSQTAKMVYDAEREAARQRAAMGRTKKKRKSLKSLRPEPLRTDPSQAVAPVPISDDAELKADTTASPSASSSSSSTSSTPEPSQATTPPPSKPPSPRIFQSPKVSASLWSAARATVVHRTQLPLALPPSQLLESRHQIATTYPQYASLLDILSNPRMARWRGDTLQLERSSSTNALVPLDGRSKYEKRLNEARGTTNVIMVVDMLPDDTTMRAKGWRAFRGFNSRTTDGHLLHVRIYHGKGDGRARLSTLKTEDKLWLASKNLPSNGKKTSLWLWAVDQATRTLSV